MRLRNLSLGLVLSAGCAGAPVHDAWTDGAERPAKVTKAAPPTAGGADATAPAVVPAAEPPPPVSEDLTPAQVAARLGGAEACELGARRLQRSAPGRAWEVLRACVERGRFTQLANLVQPPWLSELQQRDEAALLLGRVLAARGGDLLGDMATLRSARVPVFMLDTAMKNPPMYKGRPVIFRARVEEVKPLANNKATLRLAQVYLTTQDKYVTTFAYRYKASGSESASGTASGSYRSRRSRSSGEGSGSYSAAGSSDGSYEYQKRRSENDLTDTGLVALARLGAVDPFLEPGLDFVVVGRFDGVREVPGETEDDRELNAVITVLGYFEPAKGLLAQ